MKTHSMPFTASERVTAFETLLADIQAAPTLDDETRALRDVAVECWNHLPDTQRIKVLAGLRETQGIVSHWVEETNRADYEEARRINRMAPFGA